MNEEEEKKLNRRSLWNIFTVPGGQIRLIFSFMSLGLLATGILLGSLILIINKRLDEIQALNVDNTTFVQQLRDAVNGVLAAGLACTAISTVMAIGIGIIVNHRYYGPVVALKQHLQRLKEGDFTSRVHLRKDDELTDLMASVNDLAQFLEEKGKAAEKS